MINYQAVNQMLLARLEHHARIWVPHGKVVGGNYIALNPRRNDHSLGSFCLNLQKGFWIDYATGDRGGDPVSYFAYINALSQFEAGKILSAFTGTTIAYRNLTALKVPKVNTKPQNFYYRQIWREAQPANGTLVERYLSLRNPPISGGAVRLSPLSALLIVAEGIESALSVLHAQPNATVWAALSVGGIRNLYLPDTAIVKTIIIAADHDSAGIKAAIQAAELWTSTERTVKIALPPKGSDFNSESKHANKKPKLNINKSRVNTSDFFKLCSG